MRIPQRQERGSYGQGNALNFREGNMAFVVRWWAVEDGEGLVASHRSQSVGVFT